MKLKSNKLVSYTCDWKSLRDHHWTSDISLFDLVVCMKPASSTRSLYARNLSAKHISTGMDVEDLDTFSNFCKLVLRPAAYVVTIMPFFTYD